MGYYVNTTDSTVCIPKEKLDDAYKTLVELNNHNKLKGGGSYPKPDNLPENEPNKHSWFSWMDWNYHETCSTVEEILNQLGFETELAEEGLYINYYDNKLGDEETFFKALAPFIPDGQYICWVREDHNQWRWLFQNGKLLHQNAIITYEE